MDTIDWLSDGRIYDEDTDPLETLWLWIQSVIPGLYCRRAPLPDFVIDVVHERGFVVTEYAQSRPEIYAYRVKKIE